MEGETLRRVVFRQTVERRIVNDEKACAPKQRHLVGSIERFRPPKERSSAHAARTANARLSPPPAAASIRRPRGYSLSRRLSYRCIKDNLRGRKDRK